MKDKMKINLHFRAQKVKVKLRAPCKALSVCGHWNHCAETKDEGQKWAIVWTFYVIPDNSDPDPKQTEREQKKLQEETKTDSATGRKETGGVQAERGGGNNTNNSSCSKIKVSRCQILIFTF